MVEIVRLHISGETVVGAICHRDRVILILIGEDTEHRPKDLFPGDTHLRFHVAKDRRPDEIPLIDAAGRQVRL